MDLYAPKCILWLTLLKVYGEVGGVVLQRFPMCLNPEQYGAFLMHPEEYKGEPL